MPEVAVPTAVGGLVALNGSQAGGRVPLRLPVTVIGSGPGCDVRLSAPGVAPVHCLIVITPAGPVVRSLVPSATKLNDAPTAAAGLRHDDELVIGPCAFRFAWHGALVSPAGPGRPPAGMPYPKSEWVLRGREDAEDDQELELAEILRERQTQLAGLLDDLAAGRDRLRADRDAVRPDVSAAKADRAAAAKILAAAKREAEELAAAAGREQSAGRAAVEAALADAALVRHQADERNAHLDAEQLRIDAEWDRLRTESDANTARWQDAWAVLHDAQTCHAADRAATEQELSGLFRQLDERKTAADADRAALDIANADVTDRAAAVRDEIAGLEQRAFHLRLAVQELEQQRAGLTASADPSAATYAVALAGPDDRTADEIVSELLAREQELSKERRDVAAARGRLDAYAGELSDTRRVLAEQFAELAADRRRWQIDGGQSADELEELARELDGREQTAADHSRAADRADAARRGREHDVWEFQSKLGRWQATLAAHEARLFADRHASDDEIADRRKALAARETELAGVARVWGEIRTAERAAVRNELNGWAADRREYAAAVAAFDRRRSEVLDDAARVAAAAVALEQARQEWANTAASPKAERRLRVLRKRWESRFTRTKRDLDARADRLAAETARIDEKYRLLTQKTADAHYHADTATLGEPRPAGAEPVLLSFAAARESRPGTDLDAVRAAVEAAAEALGAADDRAGIVPLKAAA